MSDGQSIQASFSGKHRQDRLTEVAGSRTRFPFMALDGCLVVKEVKIA